MGVLKLKIYESGENYLEALLMLKEKNKKVRAVDIVNALGFSKPTVSIAMRNLIAAGYVVKEGRGYLELTETGMEIATRIYERHRLLAKFFMLIGVDEGNATADACKIEHDISDESFEKIKDFIQKNK